MSDDRIGCTVVYDESEDFYNVGVRLKGSEHGRADGGRQSYNISFSPEHKFRGVHDSMLLDRSGGWRFGRTTGLDEILVKHIISHAGGVAGLHDDLVRMISPQAGHTGPGTPRGEQCDFCNFPRIPGSGFSKSCVAASRLGRF